MAWFRKGNNSWRDSRLPSELLAEVAAHHGLPAPRYEGGAVTVGDWTSSVEVLPEGARDTATTPSLSS